MTWLRIMHFSFFIHFRGGMHWMKSQHWNRLSLKFKWISLFQILWARFQSIHNFDETAVVWFKALKMFDSSKLHRIQFWQMVQWSVLAYICHCLPRTAVGLQQMSGGIKRRHSKFCCGKYETDSTYASGAKHSHLEDGTSLLRPMTPSKHSTNFKLKKLSYGFEG